MSKPLPDFNTIQFTVIVSTNVQSLYDSYELVKARLITMEPELLKAGIHPIYEPQTYNTAKRMAEFRKILFENQRKVLWLVEPKLSIRLLTKPENFHRELDFQNEVITRSRGTGRNLSVIAFDQPQRYDSRPDYIKYNTLLKNTQDFIKEQQSWL